MTFFAGRVFLLVTQRVAALPASSFLQSACVLLKPPSVLSTDRSEPVDGSLQLRFEVAAHGILCAVRWLGQSVAVLCFALLCLGIGWPAVARTAADTPTPPAAVALQMVGSEVMEASGVGLAALPFQSWLGWTSTGLAGIAALCAVRVRRRRAQLKPRVWDSTLSASRDPMTRHGAGMDAAAVATAPPRNVQSQPMAVGRSSNDFGPEATDPMMVRPCPAVEDHSAASVDDLIDLDQQCEFFVALGQDAAAVELLREELRSGLHRSPLLYLKLLQIHQRQGDTQSHDRVRRRLLQRFAVRAPEWTSGWPSGRASQAESPLSLAGSDGPGTSASTTAAWLAHAVQQPELVVQAPELLLQLQSAWPRPAAAQAVIHRALFPDPSALGCTALRDAPAAVQAQRLDPRLDPRLGPCLGPRLSPRLDSGLHSSPPGALGLEAYQELLFLYALAEDVQARDAAHAGEVDLCLPLNEAAPSVARHPRNFSNDFAAETGAAVPAELDLDLSGAPPPLSFFDPPHLRQH